MVCTFTNQINNRRMTGGGSVFKGDPKSNLTRTTHGFELHCNVLDLPNNLEINWAGDPTAKGPASENNFKLTVLDTADCFQDASVPGPGKPKNSTFNTFVGTGHGRLNNGAQNYTIEFTFVDGGEPGGTADTAKYLIKDSDGNIVLQIDTAAIKQGNQQAHG